MKINPIVSQSTPRFSGVIMARFRHTGHWSPYADDVFPASEEFAANHLERYIEPTKDFHLLEDQGRLGRYRAYLVVDKYESKLKELLEKGYEGAHAISTLHNKADYGWDVFKLPGFKIPNRERLAQLYQSLRQDIQPVQDRLLKMKRADWLGFALKPIQTSWHQIRALARIQES